MRGSIKISVIKDITVYVHWTFLFLVGWILVTSLIAGFTASHLLWGLLLLLCITASLMLHELGHVLVASRFGIYAKNVIFMPIGGVASIEKFPDNPRQELAVSIAGPIVNLLIAMSISVFLPDFVPFWSKSSYVGLINSGNFLAHLFIANMFLAIFNLIPAFPMDGGRILRALLGFKFNFIKATSIAAVVSQVAGWILIVLGIAVFNPFIPLAGIFIIFFAGIEEYYLRLKSLVKGIKLGEALMYDYHSLTADMTVDEAANILANKHSRYFIVMDGSRPVGTVNRMEIIKALAEMKYDTQVKQLMKENLKFFDAHTDLEAVIDQMSNDEEKVYPVMENKHFIGVINFQHIIEFLLIHKAQTKDYNKLRTLAGSLLVL
jgi:Zn-dependent protease